MGVSKLCLALVLDTSFENDTRTFVRMTCSLLEVAMVAVTARSVRYNFPGGGIGNIFLKNTLRAGIVWLDDYMQFVSSFHWRNRILRLG